MPNSRNVNNLKINKLTEAQFDTAVQQGIIGADEISILTDAEAGQTIQYDTMPTAGADNAGWIVQYTGATDATYTHGYVYENTESLDLVGPSPDATDGEPGESMVFGLDGDAFNAYLLTKGVSLTEQTAFYLYQEYDEHDDPVYILQDSDYEELESFSDLTTMADTTGITWGGQDDFTGDFPYIAENSTGFVVEPTYAWTQIDVQPAPQSGVTSVNGQTGVVTITAAGLGALENKVQGAGNSNVIAISSTTTTYGDYNGSSVIIGNGDHGSGYSGVAIGYNAKITASSAQSIAIGNGSQCGYDGSVVIGAGATQATSYGNSKQITIGNGTTSSGSGAICIGSYSTVSATKAIQLGSDATNSDARTFKVANGNGNFEMMSADGTIPEGRLTKAIIQKSTMPTASADLVGKIYQFIGTTDASYTNGYFYKCDGTQGGATITRAQVAGSITVTNQATFDAFCENLGYGDFSDGLTYSSADGYWVWDGTETTGESPVSDLTTEMGITYTGTPQDGDHFTFSYTAGGYSWERIDVQPSDFVKKTGDTMSGALTFTNTAGAGGIFGYTNGVVFFYMNGDTRTQLAALSSQGFAPYTNNTMILGGSNLKWHSAHISTVYTSAINNGANISVPTTGGTMVVATPPTTPNTTWVLKATVDANGNHTVAWVQEV